MPDRNDYPTDEELAEIRAWPMQDLDGLMAHLRDDLWHWGDWGVIQNASGEWELHTGGWSGNEDIMEALIENAMWWMLNWKQSSRGGHYLFLSSLAPDDTRNAAQSPMSPEGQG